MRAARKQHFYLTSFQGVAFPIRLDFLKLSFLMGNSKLAEYTGGESKVFRVKPKIYRVSIQVRSADSSPLCPNSHCNYMTEVTWCIFFKNLI